MTIYFLRHAQSMFNIGHEGPDPGITDDGKRHASTLTGEYDLVIVSGMLRTIETLEYSNIKYKEKIICDLCREYKAGSSCDYKVGEPIVNETIDDLRVRIEAFKNMLRQLSPGYPRILVISHAVFMQFFLQKWEGIYNCQLIQANI